MSFLSRLLNRFKGGASSTRDRYFSIYVLDQRCREPLSGQVDLMNEISISDEQDAAFYVRKVLHTSGRDRCFGQVEIQLWLDQNKNLLRHEVQGGRWLTAEEYAAEVARQAVEANAAVPDQEEEEEAPSEEDKE